MKRVNEMTISEKKAIATKISDYLDARSIPRKHLVDHTGLGKSTLEKLFIGLFTESTLIKLESWAKETFRKENSARSRTASITLGSYSLETKLPYVGKYLFVRPSYEKRDAIHLSMVDIQWNEDIPGLVMNADKKIFQIKIPEPGSHVYVSSSELHPTLLIALSRMSVNYKMLGVVLTMTKAVANSFIPCVAPVGLFKVNTVACSDEQAAICLNGAVLLRKGDRDFAFWLSHIKDIVENYSKFRLTVE